MGFDSYYQKAVELYEQTRRDNWTDPEMQALENTHQEVVDGNWLN